MSEILRAGSPLDKHRGQESVTDFDRKVAASLENPAVHMLLLDAFKEYMTQYQAINQSPIPIGHIFGFKQFTASHAEVITSENTTSATYADLATAGPSLANLSNGRYVILFGAGNATNSGAGASYMSFQLNSFGASDDDASLTGSTADVPLVRATTATLVENDNSVVCKYRASGGTATFARRWIIAIKFGNV